MIKEITAFVNYLPPEFKTLGAKPKDGLHILLKLNNAGEVEVAQKAFTRDKELTDEAVRLLQRCQRLTQLAWMIDSNKCIDTITKAIHSCSPYCLAIRRESLLGGEKYQKRRRLKNTLVYDSLKNYFMKAKSLIQPDDEQDIAQPFKAALDSQEKIHKWLNEEDIPQYAQLKDNEYVVFYFDVSEEKYAEAYNNYCTDERIFSKGKPILLADKKFGISAFLNGFSDKKPFLIHQTATFDISNRISSNEARSLFEFSGLLARNILPNPLPIFIYQDELMMNVITYLKKSAKDGGRITFQEIMKNLFSNHERDLHNYYILFSRYESSVKKTVISDFDFVTKFEYKLIKDKDKNWNVTNFFGERLIQIDNIFQFEREILPVIFNNSLVKIINGEVVALNYFSNLNIKNCKSFVNLYLVQTYRKAFYDFIYKSQRQSISESAFNNILKTSIIEDVSSDEYRGRVHSKHRNIIQKMNIWFSLAENFNLQNKNKNKETMASKLSAHRDFMKKLAKGEASIEYDDQYTFAAGQVIYYLMTKSKTADRSYKRLEPFLQQVHSKMLNEAIARLFDTYKHENFSKNFRIPFAEVMDYETHTNIKKLAPAMLAGIFSTNELFSVREKEQSDTVTEEEETID